MPAKPKTAKHTTTVVVNGKPMKVILHPPQKSRRCWYAYWKGILSSKSTGQRKLEDAIVTVDGMVRSWASSQNGKPVLLVAGPMSDQEFDEIQRVHFSKHQEAEDQTRAKKTHKIYDEASTAFRRITSLTPIALATADDCAKFQQVALTLPKNWRQQHPRSEEHVNCISPNTVLKWSRALQAAFERTNRNAGKKCVRGVVPEGKLLAENPWNQFTWIGGRKRPIRQFSHEELVGFLDFLKTRWSGVTAGSALAKMFLWSRCRLSALTSLRWEVYRPVGAEHHFHVIEKQGVEWWFRAPDLLFKELMLLRGDSPYVFAAYNEQLRIFHRESSRSERAAMVGKEFKPTCLGDWFYDRLAEWSASSSNGHAHPHVYRKTSLQLCWDGEDRKAQTIRDTCVGEGVLRSHYLQRTDRERHQESNRNFKRIIAGLPDEVARRYGHIESSCSDLQKKLEKAIAANDWSTVSNLSADLACRNGE